MRKTTKKDFDIYKEEALKWIKFFGLKNWCIEFSHREQEFSDTDNVGWVEVQVPNKMALVCFNKTWIDGDEFHRENEIRLVAFHEVCEILLADLDYVSRERFSVSEDLIEEKRHEVIHILENSVFKKGGI